MNQARSKAWWKWRRGMVFLAAACLASLGPAEAALFDPHFVHSGKLPNGLRVIVEEDRGSPVVAVEVVARVGVADEPPDQGGIAHLLEHVLWGAGGEDDPRAEIEEVGGVTNAGTRRDFTHFYATVPAGQLNLAVGALARVVLAEKLEEEVLDRERQVILEEAALRGDEARARLSDLAFERVYGEAHPYGRRLEGSSESLARINAVRLGAFHRAWYVPNNMAVVVAGDVTFQQVTETAGAAFGHLTPAPAPSRTWAEAPRPARRGGAVVGTALPDAYVMAAFVGPAFSEPTEVCATDVLTVLLSHVTVGRLNGSLAETGAVAQATGVDYLTQRDRGLVGVWAICDPANVEQAQGAIRRELARLAEEPLSPKELMVARRLTLAAYSFANETASGRASTLAFYEALGSYREAFHYPQRVRAVTASDIQNVARWYAEEPVWIVLAGRGAEQ